MKLMDRIVRCALACVFILFGLSKFYAFMPVPPMMPKAANFIGALVSSGYLWQMVGIFEVLGGSVLLFDRTSNIGLILLGPVIVNIVTYLLFLQIGIGFPPIAMTVFLLSGFVFLVYRRREEWSKLLLG
ncbi:DoxX family membrane protein [Leptospira kmetyi]|uniref:DoxX family membrane protein n=1 Tax=Leptospira kmetyi TaxID=408139 RepID=A0ABX4NHZ6_9LEPT|nr:DoxX family membrane protein [Leptospira kmetyi]EQA53614.1 DoxX family protein [Leptospira kmetyi serovar Malaysia str. Bejo-Iso9]PJZ31145.1 DoxX family membrane protein [Leptospira kmetyi]